MKKHQKADKEEYYKYYRKRIRAVDVYKELERYRKLVKPSIPEKIVKSAVRAKT
ncbi:MAG: hypothetical protein ACXQS7_05640 [Candidatus Syntropharchaeia archaeon]